MAHDAKSGIDRVMEDIFHEPSTPTMTRRAALALATAALERAGQTYVVRLVSDRPVRRGGLRDASGAVVLFPEGASYDRCFVALFDPTPTARWAHPAHFAFVPADGSAPSEVAATTLPQHPLGPVHMIQLPEDEGA